MNITLRSNWFTWTPKVRRVGGMTIFRWASLLAVFGAAVLAQRGTTTITHTIGKPAVMGGAVKGGGK
jgi:hypothetical protein